MANVSAQMVKELRDKTGAGMMDCKAALGETNGDMESAVDWLRKKGLAGPRGTADDLKKLTGVSGAIEKKLNDLGIFHYWQLAELDHDTAHQIAEEERGVHPAVQGRISQEVRSEQRHRDADRTDHRFAAHEQSAPRQLGR